MMRKRVAFVSGAVATLGLAAAVLGFVSEWAKSKAFVSQDGQRCVYQRTAAFGCGIAAAVLALAGVAIVTTASGWFGRYGGATAPGYRRSATSWLPVIAWVVVLVAAMLFLYGASRNAGGTSGQTRTNRTYSYGCAVLRGGVFVTASVASGVATACAIAAYVNLHAAEPEPGVAMGQPPHQPYPPTAPSQFAQPGVAMGQPQWPQPYPPVAYPAAPHHGYGYGYAGKQPPGTA